MPDTMTPEAFRLWRRRCGFKTQAAAGEALGRSKEAVGTYETGAQPIPKAVRLAMLAIITLGARDYAGPATEEETDRV